MSDEPRFEVFKGRDGDKMYVGIHDNLTGDNIPFSFKSGWDVMKWHHVPLKARWWSLGTPSDKVRDVYSKARRKADRLNHQEMYIGHEAEIAERRP